ncbi:PREDICTED: jacalin-related lectin 24-like [Camelina sativa]|uniref:Jacalin-related lectin 24-like n=1 Tax=Camelina sativa TaxID=90675 RepID=A0ABM0YZN9_CAMSA|nr:PREDICTED: jacalin-related lectin 24-like [Camelina sativa]
MKLRNREMFKIGPIGSKRYSHKSWDEKGHNMITSIHVAFDDTSIRCIQFGYLHKGIHVVSKKYGSSGGRYYEIVRLKDDEYVTGLSAIDCNGIKSLNFHTNQGKHGPFGDSNNYYSSSIDMKKYKRETDVKIRDRRDFGGFFGSFHEFDGLKSIGIYVNPTYDNKLTFNQACDPRYTSALHYQIPTIVDGIPVKHIRYKTKLKDRLLSKLRSISKELFCAL